MVGSEKVIAIAIEAIEIYKFQKEVNRAIEAIDLLRAVELIGALI